MSWQRTARHLAILVGPIVVGLLAQWLIVSSYTAVTVAPFGVWALYSSNPLASLLLSLAFPLLFLVLYREHWRGNVGLALAWPVFAAALMEFIVLAEEGRRFNHGNFLWGPYMAIYLVFLSSADIFFRQAMSAKFVPVLTVFLLHLASGLYFFWRIVTGQGYM
jgi:hypothetical protein